jgi:hypothetical protein
LKSLKLVGVVQCNRGALPYLSPGKNKIAVSVADPKELGDNRLAVTYAYELGYRDKSYEQMADAGAELARGHYARWPAETYIIQKVFSAKDLPATFDIDIPTPKGKYPVYPRMLFMRREVVSPRALPHRNLVVYFDPERLRAYNLSQQEVADALNKANIIFSSAVSYEEATVICIEVSNLDDIKDLPNLPIVLEKSIYLRDLGRVEEPDVQPLKKDLYELKTMPNPFLIGSAPPVSAKR